MKRGFLLLILTIIGGLLFSQPFEPMVAKSIKVFDLIRTGKIDSVQLLMNPIFRNKADNNSLESGWENIEKNNGKYLYISDIEYDILSSNKIVYLSCQFEDGTSHLKLTWDQEQQLTGLYFIPYKPLFRTGKLNHLLIFLIILAWEFIWKAIALWKAAQRNEKFWFLMIFLIISAGILPIVYLGLRSTKPFKK